MDSVLYLENQRTFHRPLIEAHHELDYHIYHINHSSRVHVVVGPLPRQPVESIPSSSPGSQPLTSQLKVTHPPRMEGRLPDSW